MAFNTHIDNYYAKNNIIDTDKYNVSNKVLVDNYNRTLQCCYNNDICGGFEQDNLTTVQKLIKLYNGDENYSNYLDLNISRPGQDMRYALDDSKLQSLGWKVTAVFDDELKDIIEYYKNNFIW